jgi:threonine dehydrogenase-like Zn-dependent dehydrogenase
MAEAADTPAVAARTAVEGAFTVAAAAFMGAARTVAADRSEARVEVHTAVRAADHLAAQEADHLAARGVALRPTRA